MGAKERDIVEPAAVYRAFSPFSRMPIGESDMANLTEQWGRILTDNFDRWLEALLATLKNVSTPNWGSGHSPAMPTTIERIIQIHLEKIDPSLRKSYCDRAKSRVDQLVEQNDPYVETLRRASALLADRLKRTWA